MPSTDLVHSASVKKPHLRQLLEGAALRVGANVTFADNFGYAGYISFQSGRRAYFKGTAFSLNKLGACQIAADKDYAAKLLKSHGYCVPESVLIFSPAYRQEAARRRPDIPSGMQGAEAAIECANAWGFPLFVKPNDGSGGRGVSRAASLAQMLDDIHELFATEDSVLVQRPVEGNDYRVVVLDGKVLSAYQRIPFGLIGDGRATIAELMESALVGLLDQDRGAKVDLNDTRMHRELVSRGLGLHDTLEMGVYLPLLPNANLSTGGRAVDITSDIHPDYASLCARICVDMDLRLCGIDLISGDLTKPGQDPTVLEINSAPGLNNFAALGVEQEERVISLYVQLFEAMNAG